MRAHNEKHRSSRAGWLRAAILGADDGIVSTASLMLGVAATAAPNATIAVAGLAGLVAGAASMATGEFVSVSSQADAEASDIARETKELKAMPAHELQELKRIYMDRGLDEALAFQVATRLMEVDALGSHLRDELGITDEGRANPVQAAVVSALAFASGAALPLLALWLTPLAYRSAGVAASAILFLAGLGALGGRLGGAAPGRAAIRVTIGGVIAMAATHLVGKLVGFALD